MDEFLSFDDVLLTPQFSNIRSRKDCDTSQEFLGLNLQFPLINANMDSVASSQMAIALSEFGAMGSLHRFQSIEDNLVQYDNSINGIFNKDNKFRNPPFVSVGIGVNELLRATKLNELGARRFILDVAHGASIQVVEMYDQLRTKLSNDCYIVVGNFATHLEILEFNKHVKSNRVPHAFKVGIGGGSVCTTRIVTGAGCPTFSSILSCVDSGYPIIADGGIRNSGDIAKALAAGATAVMVGGLLSGTDESGGIMYVYNKNEMAIKYDGRWCDAARKPVLDDRLFKIYRGSASKESYAVQEKDESWRTAEGASTLVPYKGLVTPILENLQAGVKSSMSYVGANNLTEFRNNAKFIRVTNAGVIESAAHAKGAK